MRRLRRTLVEATVLVLIGGVTGFAANHFAKKRIDPTKNYFDKTLSPELAQKAKDKKGFSLPTTPGASSSPSSRTPNGAATEKPVHPYQDISVEEVISTYNDPDTTIGLAVFIDARADEPYAEGHIPGAIQCDHYNLDAYVEEVAAAVRDAEKVIVYCNGGKCEDSQHVCRELIENLDVPYEKVFLFEGGWQEWVARKQPVESIGQ